MYKMYCSMVFRLTIIFNIVDGLYYVYAVPNKYVAIHWLLQLKNPYIAIRLDTLML